MKKCKKLTVKTKWEDVYSHPVSEQLVELNDVALKEVKNLIRKNQILLDGYNEILSLLLDTGGVTKEQIVGILQETIKKHNEK